MNEEKNQRRGGFIPKKKKKKQRPIWTINCVNHWGYSDGEDIVSALQELTRQAITEEAVSTMIRISMVLGKHIIAGVQNSALVESGKAHQKK